MPRLSTRTYSRVAGVESFPIVFADVAQQAERASVARDTVVRVHASVLDFRDRILFMKRNHIRFHARDPLAAQRLQSLSLSLCSYRLSSSL